MKILCGRQSTRDGELELLFDTNTGELVFREFVAKDNEDRLEARFQLRGVLGTLIRHGVKVVTR